MTTFAQAVSMVVALALSAGSAFAALKPGDEAPDFEASAALGGKTFRFSLAEARAKGPVVLYFYPKAFTSGCTIEANSFAEASERYAALGATVVGMSNDDIETLRRFSVEACRSKFAVAADAGAQVMRRYDAAGRFLPSMASRISYVISPQGRIIFAFASISPDGHVEKTLEAIRQWKAGSGR